MTDIRGHAATKWTSNSPNVDADTADDEGQDHALRRLVQCVSCPGDLPQWPVVEVAPEELGRQGHIHSY